MVQFVVDILNNVVVAPGYSVVVRFDHLDGSDTIRREDVRSPIVMFTVVQSYKNSS